MGDFQKYAKKYIELGYNVIPIEPRGKKPYKGYSWKDQSLTVEQLENYPSTCNIGIILGERSNGLIDIDLDTPEAVMMGGKLFPTLTAFGRASNPTSHPVAMCPSPGDTVKYDLTEKEAKAAGFSDGEKTMIVELRANKSQTVFPPSTYEDGEQRKWQNGFPESIPSMEWDELVKWTGICAFLAVILKTYPKVAGIRDAICMALAGALLKVGLLPDMVDKLVIYIAEKSGDEEAHMRGKAYATQEKMDAGEEVTGLPTLCELLGIEILEKKLRKWLYGAQSSRIDSARPAIVMIDGDLVPIIEKAEELLIQQKVGIYQRGQMLVRQTTLNKSSDIDGVKRNAGTLILLEVKNKWLVQQMSISAQWLKVSMKGELFPSDPAQKYADHILARAGEWNFNILKGIVSAPTLRADGSILQTPGYDADSQLIFNPLGYTFPEISDAPSKEDARKALCKILSLFETFPFTNEESLSVILAALLTSLIRRSLNTAPLFALDAPAAGSGKSLLAEVTTIIATGGLPAMVSQGKSIEEDEKRLSSILSAGDAVIVIDNCERPIEGDFLCSMLTQEMLQARILGKSEMILLPSNSLVIATGNNIVFAGDMARRALICRIDAKEERPDMRQFDFDPREKAKEERGELVAAGLTILRAYIVAGRPNPMPKIGSFEQWNVVREALVWLGCADPEKTRSAIMASDPRKAAWSELLDAWYDCFKDKPTTLSEVQDAYINAKSMASKYTKIYQMLIDLTGRSNFNARSIGATLRSYVDRVEGGKVMYCQQDSHGARWYVVETKDRQKELF